jgi:hypothetical protein
LINHGMPKRSTSMPKRAAQTEGPLESRRRRKRGGDLAARERQRRSSELTQTWIGDANLDGEFNSSDLLHVFQTGQYEDVENGNSNWSTGDWNTDGDFASADL